MEQYSGIVLSEGITTGRIWYYVKQQLEIERTSAADARAETERYEKAKMAASGQLEILYQEAMHEVGEEDAAIFETHSLMLFDEDFNTLVYHFIESEKMSAEYAVRTAADQFIATFSRMQDDYMKERAVDIKDIAQRLLRILTNHHIQDEILDVQVIVAAQELTPSEAMQMNKSRMLGLITQSGTANSHAAILARTMNLPFLSGIPVTEQWNGRMAVVDAVEGILYLDPDAETLSHALRRQKAIKDKAAWLKHLIGEKTITKTGQSIRLYANVGTLEDVSAAMDNDAEGIGLLRSEFMYMEKKDYPTEEELFECYRKAAQMTGEKRLVIRTLDIGADKQADYFHLDPELNPTMGLRGIRLCLDRPWLFKMQLRAIYRASSYGNLAVMYPMITSVSEVRKIRQMVEEVRKELREEQIVTGEVRQGVMIETPAAVMISDLLAQEVDFFSIGTNDLGQYVLAADRQNPKLADYYDVHHPAILRMIEIVVKNGHKYGCEVAICGELAGDEKLTEEFLRMGIDELSVLPGCILPLRSHIRNLSLS